MSTKQLTGLHRNHDRPLRSSLYARRCKRLQNSALFIEEGIISAVSSRAQQEIPKNATVVDLTRDVAEAILAPVSSIFTCTAALDSMSCVPRPPSCRI
jgi:hypothetical protein